MCHSGVIVLQPGCTLLKLMTITCVHTQDAKGQAAEPTEQPATVLESKTKSIVLLVAHIFVFSFGSVLDGLMKKNLMITIKD